MYFPYLYARKGECKAIEDLAGRLGQPQKVFPLVEPVVENSQDLRVALDALAAANEAVYLIVNPSRHGLQNAPAVANWEASMSTYLSRTALVRPTFEIRPGIVLADLTAFIAAYPTGRLGISIRSSQIPAAAVAAATSGRDVLHFLHSAADPAGYSAGLGTSHTVEVRDSFRTEDRNADYVGEEPFTSAHLHFLGEGRPGFADYTLLPGKFNASGGPLGAAVIHMSFVSVSDSSLWVHHFVSDETRQYQSTQPAKLMEAMTKLEAEVLAEPTKFRASPGLSSYRAQFAARTPTSPTYNKRQQISHHIDTVASTI